MQLIDILRRRLPPWVLHELEAEMRELEEADYQTVIRRVVAKLKGVEGLHALARSRLEVQYKDDLLDLPEGRRLTLLRNSPPILLLVLFRHFLEQSYAARFGDVVVSLQLAKLALEIAEAVVSTDHLTAADSEDLLAEANAYLANARRINSDLTGAAEALDAAEAHFAQGTRDRAVKADLLKFMALLHATRGECQEAADLLDREIALRKLLGQEAELGAALVDRGWIACWLESVDTACDYFQNGLNLVDDDPRITLVALFALAEALARSGRGLEAWDTICQARVPMAKVQSERFELNDRWIRGLACRAVREVDRAERYLASVRTDLESREQWNFLALASLDLASVHAAQGRLEDVRRLTEEAFAIYKAEGLEQRALTAVVVLQEAIEAERVTEGLAVAVANFLARFPYNKALRFDWAE